MAITSTITRSITSDIASGGDVLGAEVFSQNNAASIPGEQNATTGWLVNGATVVSSAADAYNGTYSILGDITGASGIVGYDLDADLTLTNEYLLELWIKFSAGGDFRLMLSQDGLAESLVIATITSSVNEWTRYAVRFTHGLTTRYLAMKEVNAGNASTFYVDAVSIREYI